MKCEFCAREFKRESAFEKHECEPMRRFKAKDTKQGQMAFEMFQEFKKFHRMKSKKEPLKEFLASKQYRAFMALAGFFLKSKPLDSKEYFLYLLRSGAPFRKWISEDFYVEWIKGKIMQEDADSGVQRSLETIYDFSREQKVDVHDLYDNLSGNRLCLWIRTGRVSPWFLILSSESQKLLSKLDGEMLASVEDLINPLYWRLRVQKSKEAKSIKYQLQEAKL